MPITKSAKKALKRSIKLTAIRAPLKLKFKKTLKSTRKLILEGKSENLQTILSNAFSVIDKACQKKIIHKNNASRKKSRLMALAKKKIAE